MHRSELTHNSEALNMEARVIRSMTAQLDEEIDLFEGDIVTITSIIDDTWYRGFSGERTGIFPSSHVELLHPSHNSHPQIVNSAVHPTNPYNASGLSSRQIFKMCAESKTSELDSSLSSRQLYKQCSESTTCEPDCSLSSRQIYKQCVDNPTSEIGSLEKHFENFENEYPESYPQVTMNIVPHGITLYPFCAQFDNELNFQEGEIVNLIRYIDKYWMEGDIDGKKGIFPANYVNVLVDCKENIQCETLVEQSEVCVPQNISANSNALVMFNFDAQMSGDLSVKEGEKVLVLELINNDWCQVQNNARQVGSVPCVYLSQVRADSYQVLSEGRGTVAFDEHEENSDGAMSTYGKETSNTVGVSSRDCDYLRHSSDATDLDTAMSRNLAELSLSVRYGHNYSAVAKTDITSSKVDKNVKMLEDEVHDEKPRPWPSTGDTHLKCTELPTTEFGEVELRGSDKANKVHADLHKRESIDRVPHRPAPPAPVLGQQASRKCLEPLVDPDASATSADTVPLSVRPVVEVSEDHKGEDERKKNVEQRQNVISELVMTEKEFSRDMKITYETFNLYNPSFLEGYGVDVKLLFGNILEVMHLSEDFTDQLLLALKGKSEENQCVGKCFISMASQMKSVYSEYTVNHDNVLALLEKYDSDPAIKRVLDKGVETLRYQISCFDMGSILIKPVQRVLKYPLIVNELIKYTEDDHEDKPDLLKAAVAMMDVANEINENKRRKDIVVKYLEENPATISSRISRITLHSVAKKSTRIGALLSSSLGIKTGARDELYDEQESLFYTLDKMVRSFLKNAETFVASLQETFFVKCLILENIVSVYDEDTPFEVDRYCKIVKNISSQFLNEFKRTVDSRVSVPLTLLLKCFEGPWKLVQKRYDKLLDYEAYYSRMDKSKDNRQGTINIMKNTFTALNNQLLEELPVLISLSCDVFAECVKAFVLARKLFMGKVTKQYLALFSEISEANPHNDTSLEQFMGKHFLAWSQLINSPSFIKQPKLDAGLVGVSKSFTPSASNAAASTQSSSQRAYLQSYYHVNRLYKVTENYSAKEYMELTVNEGQLLAVIKKQNPMGDPKIWFVDNGVTQGFVPSSCLMPVQNDATGQSVANKVTGQAEKQPSGSHGSMSQTLSEARTETDSPPSYDAVVSEDIDDASGHVYEEISDEELFYVLHDLTSSTDHVLHVSRGQVVKVLHKEDYDGNSEWWFVEDKFKKTGYVPANYLSKYD